MDAWETKYAANLDDLGGNKDASLLTYLNFDNQANDQSGNGLNGTLSGPAAFSADAEGFSGAAGDYAINLGGVNDKSAVIIENATLDSALNNNTMAVSFWQNTTQLETRVLSGSTHLVQVLTSVVSRLTYLGVTELSTSTSQRLL